MTAQRPRIHRGEWGVKPGTGRGWGPSPVGTLPTASKLCRFSRSPRAGTKVAMSVGAGGLSGSLWALTLGTGRRQG